MILRLHLLKLVGARVLSALAVLVAILQILDLLDVTTEILQRNLGALGVIHYALLRTPTQVEQAAPRWVVEGRSGNIESEVTIEGAPPESVHAYADVGRIVAGGSSRPS